jgi:hypothetical protein
MPNRQSRIWGWLGWVVDALILAAICAYLKFGGPAHLRDRVSIVVGILILVGIPLGIKYGSQNKFWT